MMSRRYIDSDHHRLLEELCEQSSKELRFWEERVAAWVYHEREISPYMMGKFRAAYEEARRDRAIREQAYEAFTGDWWD